MLIVVVFIVFAVVGFIMWKNRSRQVSKMGTNYTISNHSSNDILTQLESLKESLLLLAVKYAKEVRNELDTIHELDSKLDAVERFEYEFRSLINSQFAFTGAVYQCKLKDYPNIGSIPPLLHEAEELVNGEFKMKQNNNTIDDLEVWDISFTVLGLPWALRIVTPFMAATVQQFGRLIQVITENGIAYSPLLKKQTNERKVKDALWFVSACYTEDGTETGLCEPCILSGELDIDLQKHEAYFAENVPKLMAGETFAPLVLSNCETTMYEMMNDFMVYCAGRILAQPEIYEKMTEQQLEATELLVEAADAFKPNMTPEEIQHWVNTYSVPLLTVHMPRLTAEHNMQIQPATQTENAQD